MSLPDTIFIFALALIIFGPKRLPEIGRQLGKLVGEFRRASNEFKFQIEEELRQVDLADKRSKQPAIAAPVEEPTDTTDDSSTIIDSSTVIDLENNLPVGQHPNIDSVDATKLDTTELNEFGVPAFGYSGSETDLAEPESASEPTSATPSESIATETAPTITPAEGAQARTSLPFAPMETPPTPESTVPLNSHPVATEAEITHG